MLKKLAPVGLVITALAFTSCSDEQQFTNENTDAKRIEVAHISADMAKVRDYVPLYAVVAHRGSTFWAPEETESAWRWAREMGVDYLESDLQATKDGIVLANHDENLKRTTNIEDVFSDYVPQMRKDFYRSFKKADGTQLFTEDDIEAQYHRDVTNFRTYYTLSYYYAELLMLDAAKWFNDDTPEQARQGFIDHKQYVSALQDQIAYAEGKMLKRDENGDRVLPFKVKAKYAGKTLAEIAAICGKYMDFVEYDFANAYVDDPEDTGHRPGIYIEFKESWLNPKDMEQRVYDVLDECGWNICTKRENDANPFYTNDGKVNVGNTNGKVILQTFSFDALHRAFGVFKGQVPMCFLLWTGTYATDLIYTTPTGYADFIRYGLENGAHIMGPAISGAPNNYPEMNKPWQAYMIRRSGMLNHPYSFDSYAQMGKYLGLYNYSSPTEFDDLLSMTIPATSYTTFSSAATMPVSLDGLFTNRSEFSLRYMIENGFRCNAAIPHPFYPGKTYDNSKATSVVPDPVEVLERLGY